MSKYKNIGTALSLDPSKKVLNNPDNLARYGNVSKRTSQSNLTRGAFGSPVYRLAGEILGEIKQFRISKGIARYNTGETK